jgi:hypothetical protein
VELGMTTGFASRARRRDDPVYPKLFYGWEPTRENVTMNGADVSSVLCRNRDGVPVSGLEYAQPTGANQSLLNTVDADLGGRPTLEGAGNEVYQTTSAVVLPTQFTVAVVAKDENAGAFTVIFEHAPNYSSANGGGVLYSSSNLNAGLHYTSQTVKVSTIPGGAHAGRFIWIVSFDLSQAGSAAIPLARVNNTAMGATGFNASTIGTFRSASLLLLGRAGSQRWTGPWALTRIYNGVFTSAEADALYTFLRARFAFP